MRRALAVCMALLALTACSTPPESPSKEFLDVMHSTGLVPDLGSDKDALLLGVEICRGLENGTSQADERKNLLENHFSPHQADQMMDATVHILCPAHD